MIDTGKSATRAAKRLLIAGSKYLYEIHGKDHHEHSICVINIDKKNTFNEQMVLDGYTVTYRQYMNVQELEYYNSLIEKAKYGSYGLWQDRQKIIDCFGKARK